ncbi:MAG TPA: DUF4139 domain-containing protein [Saprospiraceae bacterium]|nr:DUF4139 domain-containing protein [Saprospiraceae bacterium]HMQ83803.1 DUF4139 domain-containing protein [Saprospiraceae bacterium]
MKPIILLAALLGVGQLIAQPIVLKSQIERVTVYPANAQINNIASVSLPKGSVEIRLTDLTPFLEEQSFQLSFDESGISIREISFSPIYLDSKRAEQKRDSLQRVLDSLTLEEAWVKQQKEVLLGEEALIKANQQVFSTQNGATTEEVAALQALVSYYRNHFSDLKKELFNLDKHLTTLAKLKKEVNQKLNTLSNQQQSHKKQATIRLMAEKATHTNIRFSYMVQQSGWSTFYNINASSINDPLRITMKAKVWQNTGTNWENIPITLSNAKPNRNNTQPTLKPLYVKVSKHRLDTVPVISPETYEERVEIVKKEPLPQVWSKAENTLTSTAFILETIEQIPGDGKPQQINIWEKDIPAHYQYYAVPKKSADVFLLAEVPEYGRYDLETGEAHIFHEDTYIGKTKLNAGKVNDTLRISLGIDQSIVLERIGQDFSEKKGMGAEKRETFEYTISVLNKKPFAVDVKVEDQIPVSTDKAIVVNLLEKDGAQLTPKTGKLTWLVSCMPNQKEQRTFRYNVKYPKDMVVTGKW